MIEVVSYNEKNYQSTSKYQATKTYLVLN